MARLLHILHGAPDVEVPAVVEEQVAAGHTVEVVLTPGAGEVALPDGCTAHRLDPAGSPPDAGALLDLLRASDSAVSW